jgi:two-component system chemotaxis sensor kinase CheA
MISRVMTVEAGGQMFGIPLEAVLETVRLPRNEIRPLGTERAFVLRNRTLVLLDLASALGEAAVDGAGDRSGDARIVVTAAGGQVAGLEVDRLGERMDVMMKPLDGLLAGAPGVAGTTLLGDGRVLLILAVEELLQ